MKNNNVQSIMQALADNCCGDGIDPEAIPAAAAEASLHKADKLLSEGKEKEALDETFIGLRALSAQPELRDLKAGLENFLACKSVYDKLQKISEDALACIRDIRDVEDNDRNRELRKTYRVFSDSFKDKPEDARPLLLAHNFKEVKKSLAAAHKDAQRLAEELFSTASDLDARGEKAGEGTLFFVSGDKKKKDKYLHFAEIFRTLANQARPLKE